jgi:hypothetical protein
MFCRQNRAALSIVNILQNVDNVFENGAGTLVHYAQLVQVMGLAFKLDVPVLLLQ